MIQGLLKNGYYKVKVECCNAGYVELLLDTGAFASCLSIDAVSVLTTYKRSYLVDMINRSKTMSITSLTSSSKAVHLCARNCIVGGHPIPVFHFLMADCNKSVLGMDVILAGKLFGDGEVGGIANFDYDKYLSNVGKVYTSPVYEINALSKGLTFKDYCEFNGITGPGIADEARRLENLFGWSSVYEHLNDLFNEFPWKR